MKKISLILIVAFAIAFPLHRLIDRQSAKPVVRPEIWDMEVITGTWRLSDDQAGAVQPPPVDSPAPAIVDQVKQIEISKGRKPTITFTLGEGGTLPGRIETTTAVGIVAYARNRDGEESRIRILRTSDPDRIIARDDHTAAYFDPR